MQLLSALFPLTARRIGEGLICGRERVITTKNGTAHWVQGPGLAMGEWEFTVAGTPWLSRNPLRSQIASRLHLLQQHEPQLQQQQQKARQGQRQLHQKHERQLLRATMKVFELGLLKAERTMELSTIDSVPVNLAPGQVAVVFLVPTSATAATEIHMLKTDERE